MRKAGWAVWLAHDVEGSYEEGPPTLIESAKRDRRWCQGNLQHTWLLTARGLPAGQPLPPADGGHGLRVLAALAAVPDPEHDRDGRPGVERRTRTAAYPLAGHDLALRLPARDPRGPDALLAHDAPALPAEVRRASSSLLGRREEVARFGGRWRVAASAVLETAGSTLLAPINMIFNTKFVIFTLLGQGVAWVAQKRAADEDGTDWREAIITHGPPDRVRPGLGRLVPHPDSGLLRVAEPGARRARALDPALDLPQQGELRAQGARARDLPDPRGDVAAAGAAPCSSSNLDECYRHLPPFEPLRADYGLMQAVLDPYINAMHVALLRQRRPSAGAGSGSRSSRSGS